MKIAVLMSTYNGEKYIRTQIESILSQKTDAEVKLIVRDDGSKDKTLDILKEYGIDYYTGNNLGPAGSFIDLVKRTEGYDYYAFADQDDYWMENKLEESMKLLRQISGPGLMYSNPEVVDKELVTYGRRVYRKKPYTNMETVVCAGNIIGCTIMFNEELAQYIRKHRLPQHIKMHDYYLAAVCVSIGGSIRFDDNSYMKYRQHGNNTEGVPVSKLQTLLNRIGEVKTKSKVSISEQAAEILTEYGTDITEDAKRWLTKVSQYRNNPINRLALAISLKTHYITFNKSISTRAAILLGNR